MHDTAIVLGSTGAIGKQLVTQLTQREELAHVIVLTRRELMVSQVFPVAISSKISLCVIDFEKLEEQAAGLIPAGSMAFVALGTTKKQAGSEAAFRAIDHGLVLAFARACKSADVSQLGVVTAAGANARSVSFYNRVKGEVEQDLQALGLSSVFFARPSLLLGRPEEGRGVENIAATLLTPMTPLLPKAVRPIATQRVAAAMIDVAFSGEPNRPTFVLSNAAMHSISCSLTSG
ncbi:NAD(P)H-binding protein [Halomonas sp. GT]|uniref:NAD(P)H-binding protein n=1 Tax=Halomonas sp. GT TaxID=1971364 RepID=UPI0009F3194B|nr:NAD(P)H-binding protein [Halomonas sp. GT]